jgi:hypothetical protein
MRRAQAARPMRRLVAVRVEVFQRGSAEPVDIPSERSRVGLDDQPAVLHSAVAPVSPGADRIRSQSRSQRHESALYSAGSVVYALASAHDAAKCRPSMTSA